MSNAADRPILVKTTSKMGLSPLFQCQPAIAESSIVTALIQCRRDENYERSFYRENEGGLLFSGAGYRLRHYRQTEGYEDIWNGQEKQSPLWCVW